MSNEIGTELLKTVTAKYVAIAKDVANNEYNGVIRRIVKAKYPGKRLDQLSERELHMVDYYANLTGFYMQKYSVSADQALPEVLVSTPTKRQIDSMLQ